MVNPFGVIFNPASIFRLLETAAENHYLSQDTFTERDGIWYNFDFHSEISASSKNELSGIINRKIKEVHDYLSSVNIITITLGTAFTYKLLPNRRIVANCHKVPASHFVKEFLETEEILKSFEVVREKILKINPEVKFIFTVSPVRHTKDSLELNSVSKAILRLACHQLGEAFPEVTYFPSYEIMMDDLRDYRFYKEDMIHPSKAAEKYIWEKFTLAFMEEETRKIMKEWSALSTAISHRPFHPESPKHQQFLRETIQKLRGLEKHINVGEEIKGLEKVLGC